MWLFFKNHFLSLECENVRQPTLMALNCMLPNHAVNTIEIRTKDVEPYLSVFLLLFTPLTLSQYKFELFYTETG